MADPKPNPGSAEARAQGCICPVLDNVQGRGRGGDGARFGWYVRGDCPVHGTAASAPEPADKPGGERA
jgi:hypothetical protein